MPHHDHGFPAFNLFLEYHSEELHQTHTQCFAEVEGLWYALPDNSSGLGWEDLTGHATTDGAVEAFLDSFVQYLRYVTGERYDGRRLLWRRFAFAITEAMGDEEYLDTVRAMQKSSTN